MSVAWLPQSCSAFTLPYIVSLQHIQRDRPPKHFRMLCKRRVTTSRLLQPRHPPYLDTGAHLQTFIPTRQELSIHRTRLLSPASTTTGPVWILSTLSATSVGSSSLASSNSSKIFSSPTTKRQISRSFECHLR